MSSDDVYRKLMDDDELQAETIRDLSESKKVAGEICFELGIDEPWSGEPLPDILTRILDDVRRSNI